MRITMLSLVLLGATARADETKVPADVAKEMTQKTGQKCTAVRRILVPSDRVADVKRDLAADLARIQVGDPADKATRMGPLASRSQVDEVRAGIDRLSAASEVACGGSKPIAPKGWFVAPTLLVARDARADVFHAEEVFGPVATILPYSGDAAEAAEIVRRGGGGLVCSAYSNDAEWTERYEVMVRDDGLPWTTLEQAYVAAQALVDPVLAGHAGEWDAVTRRWS